MNRPLQLLAPARNAEIAFDAIKHGADAIYIGPPSHGARSSATNSIDDIARVVEYAHIYRVKVYVTVNTIIYDSELPRVEKMIWDLYRIGVDAIIVQDMGILRLKLPPIQLHASTQCDIRTPEKALFLQNAGFSQLVLARELTIDEIKNIVQQVDVPVECFVHGALCVSYSGRCQASEICKGRSANRGECAQMCRLPYTLKDADGKPISKKRHLLSLRDLNATPMLPDLVHAGVTSFKIEGRLKDAGYVKNVVAWYRLRLDEIINANPEKYCRDSYGISTPGFIPDLQKSFNRGFTTYFMNSRHPRQISSPLTPKSIGEPINGISELNNGDGVAWITHRGDVEGARINKVEGNRISTFGNVKIPADVKLFRTSDVKFEKILAQSNPKRKIWIDIRITPTYVTACDERGVEATIANHVTMEVSKGNENARTKIKEIFSRLGSTEFELRKFSNELPKEIFIPASALVALRRNLIDAIQKAAKATYPLQKRREEVKNYPWPGKALVSSDNVANSLAQRFYGDHKAPIARNAIEIAPAQRGEKQTVMTTRYCLLKELNCCIKENKCKFKLPLTLTSGAVKFQLRFCCDRCEMEVLC